jgi:hypothetical protein
MGAHMAVSSVGHSAANRGGCIDRSCERDATTAVGENHLRAEQKTLGGNRFDSMKEASDSK